MKSIKFYTSRYMVFTVANKHIKYEPYEMLRKKQLLLLFASGLGFVFNGVIVSLSCKC